MSKSARQRQILDLIGAEPVRTQSFLVHRLVRAGFCINQSTVSRDIRELGLVKVASRDGGYRYTRQDVVVPMQRRHLSTLRELVIAVAGSGDTAVLKTDPGNAHPVGFALDKLELEQVVGTVAGDDTVFVLLSESVDWRSFRDRWESLVA